jgi:hypothetical protein
MLAPLLGNQTVVQCKLEQLRVARRSCAAAPVEQHELARRRDGCARRHQQQLGAGVLAAQLVERPGHVRRGHAVRHEQPRA